MMNAETLDAVEKEIGALLADGSDEAVEPKKGHVLKRSSKFPPVTFRNLERRIARPKQILNLVARPRIKKAQLQQRLR